MTTVSIVGGAGLAAGELLRLLQFHPNVVISSVSSTSQFGKALTEIHPDLLALSHHSFVENIDTHSDVVFLCGGHGASKSYLDIHSFSENTLIIDLSHDFRNNPDWVYGLPELNKHRYGKRIANPGCFATAIQLALLPLAEKGLLKQDIHVNALTGATGAGAALQESTQFIRRDNNVSVYKVFRHQHEAEILATLENAQKSNIKLNFVPVRGPFSRGIFVSAYTACKMSENELKSLFHERYDRESFVSVSAHPIALKQVVNTNQAVIHCEKIDDKLFVTCAIDNLLKGAAGQAIQNMNIALNLPESTGLNLKSSMF